jgi:hypothetical protein
MHFQFDMSSLRYPTPQPEPAADASPAELLRLMLDVQKEQLAYLRNLAAAQDSCTRWRAFLARWREDFPELGSACREAMPMLERTYGRLINDLTEFLSQNGSDGLDNEFALSEFLDRYGIRLAQLGTILNLVAPLAEAGSPSESA